MDWWIGQVIMVYWRVGDSEEWDELGNCLSRGSRSCRIESVFENGECLESVFENGECLESVFENGECLESAWRVLGECVRE